MGFLELLTTPAGIAPVLLSSGQRMGEEHGKKKGSHMSLTRGSHTSASSLAKPLSKITIGG